MTPYMSWSATCPESRTFQRPLTLGTRHLPAASPERWETVAGECLGCLTQFAIDVRLPLPARCPDCGADVLASADIKGEAQRQLPFDAFKVGLARRPDGGLRQGTAQRACDGAVGVTLRVALTHLYSIHYGPCSPSVPQFVPPRVNLETETSANTPSYSGSHPLQRVSPRRCGPAEEIDCASGSSGRWTLGVRVSGRSPSVWP